MKQGKSFASKEQTIVTMDKVFDVLYRFYPEDERYKTDQILESINQSHNFLHAPVFFILNFSNKGYDYASPSVSDLFDITDHILMTEGLVRGIKLFPPEYWKIFVNQLLPEILTQFSIAVSAGMDLMKMKVHYNIPMYKKNKKVGNTVHMMKPLVLDKNGMPALAIKYIFDISDYANDKDVKLVMEYPNGDNVYNLYVNKSFSPDKELVISRREEEIVKLIELGFSSKEIADKLCISLHTVNTHRKNIMKKYNIQNFQQFFYKKN